MRCLNSLLLLIALALSSCTSVIRGEAEAEGKAKAGPVLVAGVPVTGVFRVTGWCKITAQFPDLPYLIIDGDATTTVEPLPGLGKDDAAVDTVLIRLPDPQRQAVAYGVRPELCQEPAAYGTYAAPAPCAPKAAAAPPCPPAYQAPNCRAFAEGFSAPFKAVNDSLFNCNPQPRAPAARRMQAAPAPAAAPCAPAPTVAPCVPAPGGEWRWIPAAPRAPAPPPPPPLSSLPPAGACSDPMACCPR